MFNQTIEQLTNVMLSTVIFVVTIFEFQSREEDSAARRSKVGGKINLQQLLTTWR